MKHFTNRGHFGHNGTAKRPTIQAQDARVKYIEGPVITGGMGIFGVLMPHLPPVNLYRGSGQYAGFWNLFQRPSLNLLALPASPGAGVDIQQQVQINGLYANLPNPQLESSPQAPTVIEVEG